MAEFCTVKRAVSAFHIDGADGDADPDRHQVTGMVTFTPVLLDGDAVTVVEEGEPKTLVPLPIQARISDGVVFHRGVDGVRLLAGGEGMNPERLSWRARFEHMQSAGVPFKLRDVIFEAVPGGTVDLSTVAPVPGTPGVGVTRGRDGDTIESITADATHLIVTVRDGLGVVTERRLSLNDAARAVAGDVLAQAEAQAALAGDRASAAEAARDAASGSASAAAQSASNAKKSEEDGYRWAIDARGSYNSAVQEANRAKSEADRAEAAANHADGAAAGAASGVRSELSGLVSDASGHASAAASSAAAAAQSAQDAASVVSDGVADASTSMKGKLKLAGDLAGTADNPTVPGLATKANVGHTHPVNQVTGLQTALDGKVSTTSTPARLYGTGYSGTQVTFGISQSAAANNVAQRRSGGELDVGEPTGSTHATTKNYVDTALGAKLDASKIQVVSALPASPVAGTIYLVTGA